MFQKVISKNVEKSGSIAIPKTKNIKPSHFPKINPPKRAMGEPKPAANTHMIVNKINKADNKIKLDLKFKKIISIIFNKFVAGNLLNSKF